MKGNKNMMYFHEDKSLKYLTELAYKYFAKALGLENYDEIRDESQILDLRTLRVDMAFKGKEKINIYEFLSTKNNLMDVIRRIFLYLANAVVKYEMKVDVTLLTTPSVNKDSGILEYSTNQFFKPKILSFKDCDGDKFLSNINMKLKNNKKLTSDEYIQLGLVPLMYSKHTAVEQILKTIETTRKIKNMDNDFKKEILGV